ncbi:MAG: tetratricopeptide repeat protein, partial [Fimbriimonadales bacterium]|nr:tetratricopeptide repeat protein [Fimbriimonadales bacterium]
MRRATALCVGLGAMMLALCLAQEGRERVQKALMYPHLVGQVHVSFELSLDHLQREQTLAEQAVQLERAVRENPDDADSWLQLAEVYAQQVGLDKTIEPRRAEACQRAASLYRARVAQSPDDPKLVARLSLALLGLGQTDEALAQARRATQLDPKLPDGWKALARAALAGSVWALTDSRQMPLHLLQQWDDVPPDRRAAWGARLQEAREACERWHTLAPTDRDAFYELTLVEFFETLVNASSLEPEKLDQRARRVEQRALHALQHSPPMYEAVLSALLTLQGWLYAADEAMSPNLRSRLQQSLERVLREVRQAVERDYARATGVQRAQLALVRYTLRKAEDQEVNLEEFHALVRELYIHYPENPELKRSLLYLTAIRKEWHETERLCRETLQRKPEPEYFHWLIVALDEQGKLNEANGAVDEYYRALPEDPYAMLFRSLQLMRMQGNDSALAQAGALIQTAARALALSPDDRRWGYLET